MKKQSQQHVMSICCATTASSRAKQRVLPKSNKENIAANGGKSCAKAKRCSQSGSTCRKGRADKLVLEEKPVNLENPSYPDTTRSLPTSSGPNGLCMSFIDTKKKMDEIIQEKRTLNQYLFQGGGGDFENLTESLQKSIVLCD